MIKIKQLELEREEINQKLQNTTQRLLESQRNVQLLQTELSEREQEVLSMHRVEAGGLLNP